MTGALRYEWMRIRTIASSFWLSGLAVFLTVGIAFILCLVINANRPGDMDLEEITTWAITGGASAPVMPVLSAVFAAVIGAMAMGHEYRYGTNKATLSAIPNRVAVLAAKVIVLVVWVVGVAVAALVVNAVVAGLILADFNLGSTALRPMLDYIGYCVGFALAGFSLATLFRNQTGAIVAVLVWPLVIEPIALTILRVLNEQGNADLSLFYNLLPASAGRRTMFSPYELFSSLDSSRTDMWGLAASTAVFWAAIAGLVLAAGASFIKRDA